MTSCSKFTNNIALPVSFNLSILVLRVFHWGL
jgi:hypothetical protein